MNSFLGVTFAVLAVLCWTAGDFSIQRGTRRFGNWATLFLIGVLGMILLFPFIQSELREVWGSPYLVTFFSFQSAVTLIGALFLFEGLKQGKLAVIEPVFGLELPFTVFFSIIFGGELLGISTYLIIGGVFVGLLLVSATDLKFLHFHRTVFERGVLYAAIGSVVMGPMNFMTGFGSRETSPLFAIWVVHSFLAIVCFAYIIVRGEFKGLIKHIRTNPKTALSLSFFDNAAWIFYGYSMVLIPISIATALGESYIVLAAMLGIFINKEKLRRHQIAGILVAISCVTILAVTT